MRHAAERKFSSPYDDRGYDLPGNHSLHNSVQRVDEARIFEQNDIQNPTLKITIAMNLRTFRLQLTAAISVVAASFLPANGQESAELHSAVSELAEENGFNGVILVAEADNTLDAQVFGYTDLDAHTPITADTSFAIASLSKSITATLTLQLAEAGQLSLDDTVSDHLPFVSHDWTSQITIRQLLQNRSGLGHTTDIPGWFEPEWKSAQTPESFVEAALELPLRSTPGTEYYYSNIGYYLLGLIIDEASGTSYETALSEMILTPLGMETTGQIYDSPAPANHALNYLPDGDDFIQITLSNTWMFRAGASLYSNADDLLAWSHALQSGALISEDSMALLFDEEEPMAWNIGEAPLAEGAPPTPVRTYNGDMAGYTSIVSYFPEHDLTVILLSNTGPGYRTLLGMTLEIAAAATN